MARTIYVVNWTPDAVGGFEWRFDRAEAEAVAADLRKSDPTVQLHEVELPEDEEWTKYPDAITERLDAEGWSDGGDPRDVEADAYVEPHDCDRCGETYDEAKGDGYCGLCPECADADERGWLVVDANGEELAGPPFTTREAAERWAEILQAEGREDAQVAYVN